MKILVALSCIVVTCGSLLAQTNEFRGGWWFPGPSFSQQVSVSSNYSGVALSQTVVPYRATRGDGLQANTNGPARTWAFSTPTYSTFEDAILADAYIEITLTPKSGFSTQLTNVFFPASVGSGTIGVGLFSSQLGFTSEHQIGTTMLITSTNSAAPDDIQFNGIDGSFSSSSVSYRLYFTSTQPNWFLLGDSSSVGYTTNDLGLIVGGNSAVVPEPSVFVLFYAVAAFWFSTVLLTIFRRKRKFPSGQST